MPVAPCDVVDGLIALFTAIPTVRFSGVIRVSDYSPGSSVGGRRGGGFGASQGRRLLLRRTCEIQPDAPPRGGARRKVCQRVGQGYSEKRENGPTLVTMSELKTN